MASTGRVTSRCEAFADTAEALTQMFSVGSFCYPYHSQGNALGSDDGDLVLPMPNSSKQAPADPFADDALPF